MPNSMPRAVKDYFADIHINWSKIQLRGTPITYPKIKQVFDVLDKFFKSSKSIVSMMDFDTRACIEMIFGDRNFSSFFWRTEHKI